MYREKEKQTSQKLGLSFDQETLWETIATSGHL